MKAAQAITECLKEQRVSVVFGYPGAAICPFFDALINSGIKLVLVRQEQNAGHAASGYARMLNRPAVCAVTSGPGALNLLPAIAAAYMDSIPMVAITGQVSSELIGRDVFQEADITGACEPFVKHSYLVKNAEELPKILREAFFIADSGRKGPVLVDIPIDVQQAEINYQKAVAPPQIRGFRPDISAAPQEISRAAQALKNSKRPLICVGGGAFSSGCQAALTAFAEKANIPVVSTLMGISAVSPLSPIYRGMIGMYGQKSANAAMKKADLVLLVGARIGDRAVMSPTGILKSAVILHIDIDSAELNKNIGADIGINADALGALTALSAEIGDLKFSGWCEASAADNPRRLGRITPSAFMDELYRAADDDAVIAADVGQNLLWAARRYAVESGRFLTSGGMGTMGYSLPAAIGASLAANRQTIAICGDGGFQMNLMELATAKEQKLPIKLVIMNNSGLGMVRELQRREYKREIAVELPQNPDFTTIARGYGIATDVITKQSEVKGAIERMLKTDGAYLLECAIDKNAPTL